MSFHINLVGQLKLSVKVIAVDRTWVIVINVKDVKFEALAKKVKSEVVETLFLAVQ